MKLQTSSAGRVFVSYSRKDTAFAQTLTDALVARGFEAYLDVKDIAPGEPWKDRLAQLIRSADTVVFLVSPDSVKSEICGWETTEAKMLEKRILPVVHRRVEDAQVPETLSRLNFIFMDDAAAFEPQLDMLVSTLQTDLVWVREHTRLAELARTWDTNGKRNTDLLRGPSMKKAEAWIASRPADAPMPTEIHRAFIAGSRRLNDRNQGYLVTGSIGAAVLFGSLAFYAFEQRNDAITQRTEAVVQKLEAVTQREVAVKNEKVAEEQRKLAVTRQREAENNLTTAGKAIETIVFEVIEDIGTQGGISIETRKNLVDKTRSIMSSIQIKDNAKIIRINGALLGLASEISVAMGNNNIALLRMNEAQKFFEKNIELNQDKKQANNDLAVTLNKLAKIKRSVNNISEASTDELRSLDISRSLYKNNIEDNLIKMSYMSSLNNYILNNYKNGKKFEFENLMKILLDLNIEVLNSGSFKERSATSLAQNLLLKATIHKFHSSYDEAYINLKKALEHITKYIDVYSNNIQIKRAAIEVAMGLAEIEQKNNQSDLVNKRIDFILKSAPALAEIDREDKNLQLFSVYILGRSIFINKSMSGADKKLATELAIDILSKLKTKNQLNTQQLSQLEIMKKFLNEN